MTQIDWVTPFVQVDPYLQDLERPSYGNWIKVLQDSISRHT